MPDHDVVVVGGGAMGAATTWQLAADGRDVRLVEQFEPGHDRGSSHGETRIFRLAHRDPDYARLALAALGGWRALEDEADEALLDQVGQLDHGDGRALDEIADTLIALGRPVERLGPDEAAARWPGLRTEAGAVHSPDGGFVAAGRSVRALVRVAAERGAAVSTGTAVRSIELRTGGGVRVATDDGGWTARVVVVAAGAWAAPLLADLVPLPPLAVTLASPSHFAVRGDDATAWPSVLHHVPGDGALGFGAYAVWAPGVGMKVGREGDDLVVTAEDRPVDAPVDAVASLAAYVAEWFPGLDPTPLDPHTCLFTSTPDEHFVLDRRGPVVVASPCSGHGFKFVPAVGRLLADLATASDPAAPEVARLPAWRLPG